MSPRQGRTTSGTIMHGGEGQLVSEVEWIRASPIAKWNHWRIALIRDSRQYSMLKPITNKDLCPHNIRAVTGVSRCYSCTALPTRCPPAHRCRHDRYFRSLAYNSLIRIFPETCLVYTRYVCIPAYICTIVRMCNAHTYTCVVICMHHSFLLSNQKSSPTLIPYTAGGELPLRPRDCRKAARAIGRQSLFQARERDAAHRQQKRAATGAQVLVQEAAEHR